jgi:hypothetical protein
MKAKIVSMIGILVLFTAFLAGAEDNVFQIMGNNIKQTVVVTTDNNSTLLTTAVDAALVSAGKTAMDWAMARAVLITCETNAARIAFGVAASNTVGHVIDVGQNFRLPSNSEIRAARIRSAATGSAATLQVSLEF